MSGISLGRDTVLLLLSRAAGYLLALANSVILARGLGADRLGAYAYAMGLAALFSLLPNLGINPVVTRAIAQRSRTGGGLFRTGLRAQALLSGGTLIFIPAFAALLPGQPVPVAYVALAAAQLAVGTLGWPYLALLGGRARYDRVAVVELVAGVVGTVTLLGAIALHGGVVAVLWAHVLGAGIAVAVTRQAALAFRPTDGMPPVGASTLLRQAAPFGAVGAIQSLYTRLDILLLGQLASTRALGLYNVAYKPTNMLVYFGSTVAMPLFPVLAGTPQPGAPVAFRRAMRGLGATGPAMALGLSGLAGPLLQLLYGGEYAAAAPVLVVLAWSAAANWLYAPLATALQARGQERRWLAGLAGALVLNAAGNLWAIPRWGAQGAAATTLASEVVLLLFGAVFVRRYLGICPPLRPVLAGLGATAAGGAVLWTLRAAGAFPATLAALIVYGGLMVLFRVVTPEDATLILGWVRNVAPGWSRG